MLKLLLKNFLLIIFISLKICEANAISGQEISEKVSFWLTNEGINGSPIFSKNSVYKDCNNEIKIKKMYQNYKTIKVTCPDQNGFELLMRVNFSKKVKVFEDDNAQNKKIRNFKIVKLKRSLEKNDIINLNDIEIVAVQQKFQTSFYSNKKELVGRKLKTNLKMGQILHPRHLFEKFDINNGDIISIVSNVGNASVIVSGEAQDSGNVNDLIRVKNLKGGKIVKGYIKKNKIIKVFR